MTYAVAYIYNGEFRGFPLRCPTYSRQIFEEKKRLGIPCALMCREDGNKAVLIDSFQFEVLERCSNKFKLEVTQC